ncbi:Two-component phosphorelay intermediate involved in MAP kinase cascade regulation [Handroanthus impetiginosus]|uniref:Histidine-containing phosphotransfer protein n=1 Tax=Handroanthus impetiginosus TaxID=429701 RepID=A0A2G9GTW2_9LAMI|nr:Two-component phosphorelay intermediate involved in MAP kinase cascade regulation [Handroanthus impetiginosus]
MDYKKIDTQELNRMLLDRIQELEREGFVDHHFRECHSLKEDSGLSFFLDLIPVFFSDVFQVVKELAHALNQPVVNFREIYSQFIKLKGCSACFGACRIRDACSNLRQAIDNKSKEGCIQALNSIEDECKSLRDRLDGIIKVKNDILSYFYSIRFL